MKILRPSTALSTISIKVPTDLVRRVADAQAAAKDRGLTLDIDRPLTRSLARVVRQAEAELNPTPFPGQENPPAPPTGALAGPARSEEVSHDLR